MMLGVGSGTQGANRIGTSAPPRSVISSRLACSVADLVSKSDRFYPVLSQCVSNNVSTNRPPPPPPSRSPSSWRPKNPGSQQTCVPLWERCCALVPPSGTESEAEAREREAHWNMWMYMSQNRLRNFTFKDFESVYTYSYEIPEDDQPEAPDLQIYSTANSAMRLAFVSNDRADALKEVAIFRPFIYWLERALAKLPAHRAPFVYRGLKGRIDKNRMYRAGAEITWSSFSSTTHNRSITDQFSDAGGVSSIGFSCDVSKFPCHTPLRAWAPPSRDEHLKCDTRSNGWVPRRRNPFSANLTFKFYSLRVSRSKFDGFPSLQLAIRCQRR